MPENASTDRRARLMAIIRERSFAYGEFKLSSGGTSKFYFNLKPTLAHPEGSALSAAFFFDLAAPFRPDFIAGPAMGAVPSLGAVAMHSFAAGQPIGTVFVRKEAKQHGTQLLVEGLAPSESLKGKTIVVIDDVATQGRSIMMAVDAIRGAGGTVAKAIVLVDREEGGAATLKAQGIDLLSVFKASEFRPKDA